MAKTMSSLAILAILSAAAFSMPAAEAVTLPSTVAARRLVSASLRLGRKMLEGRHIIEPLDHVAGSDKFESRQLLSEDCGTPCGPICCQDYEACLAVPMLGQFCFDYSTVTQSSAAPRTRPYGDSAMGLSEP